VALCSVAEANVPIKQDLLASSAHLACVTVCNIKHLLTIVPPKTFQSVLDFIKTYPVTPSFIYYGG
jgi:hypothetical protein